MPCGRLWGEGEAKPAHALRGQVGYMVRVHAPAGRGPFLSCAQDAIWATRWPWGEHLQGNLEFSITFYCYFL